MKSMHAFSILSGLILAISMSLPTLAASEQLAEGTQAKCNTAITVHYPRLFASLLEDDRAKASPPPIALPALSELHHRMLRDEFLVRNGYIDHGSKSGASGFEFCATYGLMSVFASTGGISNAADEKASAIEIAKRFLVDNSELTGVIRKNDLVVANTQVGARGAVRIVFAPQTHRGLIVTDTGILVTVRGGKVSKNYLHWYPDHVLQLPESWITESDAKAAIIGVNLKFRGNSGDWIGAKIAEEGLGASELVITPIEVPGAGLGIVLEWKISVSAGRLKSWAVYVDAATGAITRTEQLFDT